MTDNVNFDDQDKLSGVFTQLTAMAVYAEGKEAAQMCLDHAKENEAMFAQAGKDMVEFLNSKNYPTWCTMLLMAHVAGQDVAHGIHYSNKDQRIEMATRMAAFMHLVTAHADQYAKENDQPLN